MLIVISRLLFVYKTIRIDVLLHNALNGAIEVQGSGLAR